MKLVHYFLIQFFCTILPALIIVNLLTKCHFNFCFDYVYIPSLESTLLQLSINIRAFIIDSSAVTDCL